MIKIIKSKDIEKNWFNGREFEETNETVQNVISDVIENGDSALQKYSKMFDVSSPKTFEISEHELKAAADKLKAEMIFDKEDKLINLKQKIQICIMQFRILMNWL